MPDINDAIDAGGFEESDEDPQSVGESLDPDTDEDLFPKDPDVAADDTGEGSGEQVDGDGEETPEAAATNPEIGPVPYSRFHEVNTELQAYRQLHSDPAVAAAIAQAAMPKQEVAPTEPEEPEYITQLRQRAAAGESAFDSSGEFALAQAALALHDRNTRLESELGEVRKYTQTQQEERRFAAVDAALAKAETAHGLKLTGEDRISVAEEANLYYMGAQQAGKQVTLDEAMDFGARMVLAKQSKATAAKVITDVRGAKGQLTGSRTRPVGGPTSQESPAKLTREQKMARCYKLAGGTD